MATDAVLRNTSPCHWGLEPDRLSVGISLGGVSNADEWRRLLAWVDRAEALELLMAKRKNISVSFTPHQAEFLAQCVATGRYLSASEVVREGLRLLERHHTELQAEYDRVREMIKVGAEELERGETHDADTVFREIEVELSERAEKRRGNPS